MQAEDEEDAEYQEELFLDYHVVVMVSFEEPYDPKKKYDFRKDVFKGELMGGVVFEYYVQANAGLLTYLLVDGKWRGLQIGTILSDHCRKTLEAHAKSRGHLAGCNAIFLETNSAIKVSSDKDVMSPMLRHKIFYGMGLRLVDFDYVQPPLDTDKNKVNYLLLCCFVTPRIPSVRIGNKDQYYLPTHLVSNTMHAFWVNAPMKGRKFSEDVDYKRMQDQLRRRERILLLDLPWERPFTIVDVAEHFDLELLVQFYQDLLVPAYKTRPEELDSLETWLSLLSPKHKAQSSANSDDDSVFHLLLALKYSDDEEENSKPIIAGGLALEYFANNNCGFLNYLLAPMGASGERMARALIDRAITELDNDAKSRGQLAGCNVIFMECSQMSSGLLQTPISRIGTSSQSSSSGSSNTSTPSVAAIAAASATTTAPLTNLAPQASSASPAISSLTSEVRDIDEQHPLLESMGWRLVDFDYVPPPGQSPERKAKSMLLIALITPRIPVISQEGRSQHYLPSTTLKKFMTDLWDQSCDRVSYEYENDPDFLDMIERIERRPRIPLLTRPWNKPWRMVDLQETNNPQLLSQFYEEILKKAFVGPAAADLEPIDTWAQRLATRSRTGGIFHVLLAVKTTSNRDGSESSAVSAKEISKRSTPITMLGGLAFEYFEGTNCGFITHLLIRDVPNRELIAKSLMERAVEILDQDAVTRGSLAGCNAIFLETGDRDESLKSQALVPSAAASSSSSSSSEPEQPLDLDISCHHALLHRLGWRLVDFGYVTPPHRGVSSRKARVHKQLAMFLTPRVPCAEVPTNDDYHYLPRHTLTSFINEYWRLSTLRTGLDYKKDPHFKNMMDLTTRRESVPLLDLPWNRPWSLVDLWEDFDAQLLYKFYQNSYAAQFPDRADREPLSTWLQLLSDESRDSLAIEDFHVLLAIEYPILSGSTAATKLTTTNILGGLIFTYYPSTSIGLLSYMTLSTNSEVVNANIMAKSLLEEAAVNLHENAALRGHIAGCNAIFMEMPLVSGSKQNRADFDTLYKGGWRMLAFDYWRPPLSIWSGGATPSLLLCLLTPNVPKQSDPIENIKSGSLVSANAASSEAYHYIPRAMLKTFLMQHWRNHFHRIGRTQIARDPAYLKMMQSLEGLEVVPLRDLPWGTAMSKL